MFKNLFKKNNIKTKKGFAILFSVLLASFLITLGISIFSISLKEIQITTSVRDSQIAYYAADSARECALYWDIKKGVFPACLDNGSPDCTVSTSSHPIIKCNGSYIPLDFLHQTGSLVYTASKSNFFQASSTSSSTPISDISISKTFNPVSFSVVTIIDALGHNTSIFGRRVERGIRQINN